MFYLSLQAISSSDSEQTPVSLEHSPAREGKRVLRYRDLEKMGIASRITIWRWVRDGKFPVPFDLNGHPAWLARTVDEWIESRPTVV